MPDYRFMEWSEDNFDVDVCPYVREAYDARRFAFVSDYARGLALKEHGGVYLDTDVQVRRRFDDLLDHRSFWGFETGSYVATSTFGAVPGHDVIEAYLAQYRGRRFVAPDGTHDTTTNVQVMTRLWSEHGLVRNDSRQVLRGSDLFLPQRFLSPYDYTTGLLGPVEDAYAIHHYEKTWLGPWARTRGRMKKALGRLIGPGPRTGG
jgi:hypothetical protein